MPFLLVQISNGTRMFWKALGWASFAWFQTSWSIGLMRMIEPLQCPLWFKLLTIGHQASFGSTTICFEVFSLEKKHYCGTGLFILGSPKKNNSGIVIQQFKLLLIAVPSPRFDQMCFLLLQELADHTAEVNVQHETLDGTSTFYDSISGRLHIYQVCGPFLLSPCHYYLSSTSVYVCI